MYSWEKVRCREPSSISHICVKGIIIKWAFNEIMYSKHPRRGDDHSRPSIPSDSEIPHYTVAPGIGKEGGFLADSRICQRGKQWERERSRIGVGKWLPSSVSSWWREKRTYAMNLLVWCSARQVSKCLKSGSQWAMWYPFFIVSGPGSLTQLKACSAFGSKFTHSAHRGVRVSG